MKTAMKLSKKELFSLYEKSSAQVKETLRTEFGNEFFIGEKPKSLPGVVSKDKVVDQSTEKRLVNFEILSDFTPILRMLGYAYLMWLIL